MNFYSPTIVIAILVFSVLVTFISYIVSRSISRSLRELGAIAEGLASGRQEIEIDPAMLSQNDEIGVFARTFDTINQNLSAEQIRIRQITNALPVLIAERDTAYLYTFANRAYREWNNFVDQSIVGRSIDDVLGQALADQVTPFVARGLANERVSVEISVNFVGIGLRDIEASYIPHVDSHGVVVGCFVLIIDLTERKLSEAKLQQAQKMEAVG